MSNVNITALPTVTNATTADIIYAVQGGVSVQETLMQVMELFQSMAGGGIVWTFVTSASISMMPNNGYVANSSSLVTFILPASCPAGTIIEIGGNGAGGWLVQQNASQQINIGNDPSTSGVSGGISSTDRYDSIRLLCTIANTTWNTQTAPQGNITVF